VTLDVLVPTCGRPAALAVTLTGLVGQTARPDRVVVSDQSPGAPADADPVVRGVLRVLRHFGVEVVTGSHLPARGVAEHRAHLLAQSDADHVLFLDDDVLLEPEVVARLRSAMAALGCGFVGAPLTGLSYAADVRPAEHAAFERWDGPVVPERVRKGDPAWERWRLHNAANPLHLAAAVPPGEWVAYKVAWVAGCVLFDRRALLDAGGFSFWPDLPTGHAGEDVVAQLRVMERSGGAGVLPSGAYHLELPTTLPDRRADAYALVLEAPPPAAPPPAAASGPDDRRSRSAPPAAPPPAAASGPGNGPSLSAPLASPAG